VRPVPTAPARSRPRAAVPALAAALVGVLALAGCGSSSTSSSTATPAAPSTTTATTTAPAAAASLVSVAANPEGQLKFTTSALTAKSGPVSIAFTNMSSIEHNLSIESSAGAKVGATPTFSGGTKTLTLNLAPGTYKFYCSIPGHRQAGMEGTLTVR